MNKINKMFFNKAAIDRGTYLLFTKKNAIDIVNECMKENIIIYGIDGFLKIDENTIQPSMENSIDFSTNPNFMETMNIYEEAVKFLEKKEDNLFFEISC
jgi:ABC-type tungstate transport system permease subunit